MLKELNRYENLGTPKFFHELLQQLFQVKQKWTTDNIREYFHNRIIDGQIIFDGCVALAETIGAIRIDSHMVVTVNSSLQQSLINEKYLSNKLLEMIIIAAKNDEIFYEIFCPENISYDIIYKLIQVDNSAFTLRYANFRQLLINFSFLYPHPDKNIKKLIVNSRYRKLFDSELMAGIKKRKTGVDELEKMIEQKQIYGKEAEIFVLKYEKIRLISHPHASNIEIISDYDVGAGYDIVSYENDTSISHDRFIEVKSFCGAPNFHWSRNEIDVARIKKDSYFIYLVDRDKMLEDGYIPIMIQNPHKEIIKDSSNWDKIVDSYFIVRL